ncbi:MAG TPA: hypothetical protein VFK57_02570 [Vicinamibacterales bacterium]|nr:hypothetical protein [Vicinamibacterales bacterium]
MGVPWGGRAVCAQGSVTLRSDILLYGDNTEFRNPFREGETIFGAAARVFADLRLGPAAAISLGVFGKQRFGDERALEQVRPVIALTVGGGRSRFVFGTLPAADPARPMGPDRGGPHGLLPALQRETLAFERAYEPGLAWRYAGDRLSHTLWLEWQRLNTAAHRERFDGGVEGRVSFSRQIAVPFQLHVVHEGGQQFASGPVTDSAAGALGIAFTRGIVELEWYGLAGKSVPDRERPSDDRNGRAWLARAAVERQGWRAHALVWRGRDFIKDEGDANYGSLRRDGHRYGGTRDYAEAGLARRFNVAPGAVMEVSGRLHRTERFYEYSYRVIAIASVRTPLGK